MLCAAPDIDTMTNSLATNTRSGADQKPAPEDALVMGLLHRHVPIALLCDLSAPEGPESAQILAEEGLPATAWWEH